MKPLLALAGAFALALVLPACALFNAIPTPGETPGQLFCQIESSTGVSMIVSVINADVPGAVLVTGIASAIVKAECAAAAVSAGALDGVPVSPPGGPVGSVAIHVEGSN